MAAARGQAAVYPDVVYSDCPTVAHQGPVGTMHSYTFDSYTCNIGNSNLTWASNGTPGLAMNIYRLSNGRLMQIGQSFVKRSCCAGATNNCGLSCNGAGGSQLGAGCRDVYGASYNAGQSRLSPRSTINAYTGAFSSFSGAAGDAVYKRCQVPQADLDPALNPGALYFIEGVYVGTDDAQAGAYANNASYRRVTVTAGTYAMTTQGTMAVGTPALQAWRSNGGGVGVVDTSVNIQIAGIPNEGVFHVSNKVTNLGNGRWLYDYAIFNLNSDLSGGSLSIPIPLGTNVTGVGFHDVDCHSGEIYSNTDWTMTVSASAVTWASPQTFAQNPNSNALRWGTMYNFWFEADRPPTGGSATLGLFKPNTPQAITTSVQVPQGCTVMGDVSRDGTRNGSDVARFVEAMNSNLTGSVDPDCADFDGNNLVDVNDVAALVNLLVGP